MDGLGARFHASIEIEQTTHTRQPIDRVRQAGIDRHCRGSRQHTGGFLHPIAKRRKATQQLAAHPDAAAHPTQLQATTTTGTVRPMGNQQGGLLGQFIPIPHKSALSTLVVKVWRLRHPYSPPPPEAAGQQEGEGAEEEEEGGDEVVIMLRHHRRSGHKTLTIDGREVHRAQNAVDAGEIVAFEVPVRIGPGGRVKHVPAELKVVDFPGLSEYELRINGQPIASDTDLLDDTDDSSNGATDASTKPRPARRRWTWGEAKVPSVTLQPVHRSPSLLQQHPPAVANEVAAFYTVVSTRVPRFRDRAAHGDGAGAERRRVVERRFKEFEALDAQVRGFFHAHHLASSLPALPAKQLKALTPHDDPLFLESRRQTLQDYLGRLCRFPHLDRHPDLLAFLGFDQGGLGDAAGAGLASAGVGSAAAAAAAGNDAAASAALASAGLGSAAAAAGGGGSERAGGRGQQQYQVTVDL